MRRLLVALAVFLASPSAMAQIGGPFDGIVASGGGGSDGVSVQEEGVDATGTPHATINFTGTGVTAADATGGVVTVDIPATTFDGGDITNTVGLPDGTSGDPSWHLTGNTAVGFYGQSGSNTLLFQNGTATMTLSNTQVISYRPLLFTSRFGYIGVSSDYLCFGAVCAASIGGSTTTDAVFAGKVEVQGKLFLPGDALYIGESTGLPNQTGYAGPYPKTDDKAYWKDGANVHHELAYAQECHSEMWQNDNAVATTISVAGTWVEVDNFTSGLLDNWTHATGDLTVGTGAGGNYQCSGAVSSASAGTNQLFEFSLSINNVVQDKCDNERKYSTTDTGSQAVRCDLTLVATDVIRLNVRNITSTSDITIVDANVGCHRL